MANKTKIEWADHTINPIIGCTKCSSGCDRCYAEAFARRLRDQCKAAGVPFFFKQMSGKAPIPADLTVREIPQ